MLGKPGVTGAGTLPLGSTFTEQVVTRPPLVNVKVFIPVDAKFALKLVPFGLEIERSGDDHVYVPLPPEAETIAVWPKTTSWVAGKQVSAPVAGAATTFTLQVAV